MVGGEGRVCALLKCGTGCGVVVELWSCYSKVSFRLLECTHMYTRTEQPLFRCARRL